MSKLRRVFVDGRYGQMHVRYALPEPAHRKARPLLLLHMFPQSSRGFEPLIELMGADRIVIAPDFPGLGDSQGPEEPIRAQDYAASIWGAVDALDFADEIETLDLFGIHAGAKLGVEVILQHPHRVESVVLASAAVLDEAHVERIRRAFTPVPLDAEGTRFQRFWNMLVTHCRPQLSFEQIGSVFGELVLGGEEYTWGNNSVLDYNAQFKARLRQIPHHVDLLNPGDDLFELTQQTMQYLANADYHERPDWKQGFHISHAEELADFIRELLSAERLVGARMRGTP